MTDTANAAAAPTEYTLPDGKTTLTLYPLRLKEVGQWERWAKRDLLGISAEALHDQSELTEFEMRIQQSEAHRVVASFSFGSAEAHAYLLSFQGMMKVIYLSWRQGPGLADKTMDDLEELIPLSQAVLMKALEVIMDISGLLVDDDDESKNLSRSAESESESSSPENESPAADQAPDSEPTNSTKD